MAAKIWYKYLKVGDRVQVSLDKNHLWANLLPSQVEATIDTHMSGEYFTLHAKHKMSNFIIIDYSGHFDESLRKCEAKYNYSGSIIKKLPQ